MSSDTQLKTANEKYCTDCGKLILLRAEICPGCGCRQITPEPIARLYRPDPIAGPMILLLLFNVLWNGLGNIVVGDKRGWGYGFLNWVFFVLSFFTLWVPCVLFFAYCGWEGYEHLRRNPPQQMI